MTEAPLILSIETATGVCSVALAEGDRLLAVEESHVANSHAELITLLSQKVLDNVGKHFSDLHAVAVSMGPGSYTGLRIGVSTAKGLCYALNIPLIAISTLEAMALGMSSTTGVETSDLLCPMIDARRMEVYNALYTTGLKGIQPIEATIVTEETFSKMLAKQRIWFGGDGAPKCKPLLQHSENALFLDDFGPSSRWIAPLAYDKYVAGLVEDTAYFEPFYLKDFVAGIPRVKGLHG